jgi:hypothetical protein
MTMASNNGKKMYTVDKFLGLNESVDGNTELKMGEASRMVNWAVTDGYNITTRPGIRKLELDGQRDPSPILAAWAGHIGKEEFLVICDFADNKDRLWVYGKEKDKKHVLKCVQEGALGLTAAEESYVKIFYFNKLYVMSKGNTVTYENGVFQTAEPYIPLVITGADPAGAGTTFENINLLTGKRRIEYSADGTTKDYYLPAEAVSVVSAKVDNKAATGSFDTAKKAFVFSAVPEKGVANVEIVYDTDSEAAEVARMQIVKCTLTEAYNGATDTRLFMAGDGSNRCYYTGVPMSGGVTALYFPAMYEVAMDFSGSAVTGMVRSDTKLLVFKPDGANLVSYEPTTLTDGTVTAGFTVRSANREFGSDVVGQVQTVANRPRTITKDGIFEWKITSDAYQSEHAAKRISDKVEKSLKNADIGKIVTCDDNYSQTYYVFLNDEKGTVLVNRYGLASDGIWCLYRGKLLCNVRQAMMHDGTMVFATDKDVYCFDEQISQDVSDGGKTAETIEAIWESGFMDFGADFRRKYSSQIYISMLPASNSEVTVTAQTDRRSEYMEKPINVNVFSWANANFVDWTFDTNDTPKIKRVRLKIKKFVYYKLIFRVAKPGAKVTVMGYDQEVRFASMAK